MSTLTVDTALDIARNLIYGPLPKKSDPVPSVAEAIGIIREARKTCGHTWLTGDAAIEALEGVKA